MTMDTWVIFILKNVAMNVRMQCLRRCINSFGYTPREMELLAHVVNVFEIFEKRSDYFP